jgi:hypothetical protein
MDRRCFLQSMIGATIHGVAAAAAVRTFPFRVFSFPKEIVAPGGRVVTVTMELLRDSSFDVELFLRDQFARRFGAKILSGSSPLQIPPGLLANTGRAVLGRHNRLPPLPRLNF